MKQPLILLIALLISAPAFAQEPHIESQAEHEIELGEQEEKLATELGFIYIGMSKEDLYKVLSEVQQIDHRQEGSEEWITFSDWTTEERRDLITFHLVDGKVEGWEKPKKKIVFPEI